MPRINFRMGHQYEIDLRGKLRYGEVSEQRLAERFTDGRLSGLLNEELLAAHFRGLSRNEAIGGPNDLFGVNGEKYEVKTVTRKVSFRPSNQHGQGRVKDDAAALERMQSLHGYILVDVRRMPAVTVYFVSAAALITRQRFEMTARQFDRLIPGLLQASRAG